MIRSFILCLVALAFTAIETIAAAPAARPNIVFILSDDVGYGDLGCYGAQRVKTPNLDRIAREGLRFTDAHAPASVCTPTRYAFFTGKYAWRQPGTGIAPGNATLLIPTNVPTVASVLKQAGYNNGLVGKWHLGLGTTEPDFNGELKPGPLEIGFDSAFFIPATGDRVPCVFVENHRVFGLDPKDPIRVSYSGPIGNEPLGSTHPQLLKIKADPNHSKAIVNGISRIGYMTGGTAALWKDEDIADVHRAAGGGVRRKAEGGYAILSVSRAARHPRADGAASAVPWHERLRLARRRDSPARLDGR